MEAIALGLVGNAAVADGCVQSTEWFPDSDGTIFTGVELISLLERLA